MDDEASKTVGVELSVTTGVGVVDETSVNAWLEEDDTTDTDERDEDEIWVDEDDTIDESEREEDEIWREDGVAVWLVIVDDRVLDRLITEDDRVLDWLEEENVLH